MTELTKTNARQMAERIFNEFDMIIYTDQDHYHQVKQCSLTAVNYIINAITNTISDSCESLEKDENFWNDVKAELI